MMQSLADVGEGLRCDADTGILMDYSARSPSKGRNKQPTEDHAYDSERLPDVLFHPDHSFHVFSALLLRTRCAPAGHAQPARSGNEQGIQRQKATGCEPADRRSE